MMKRDNSLDYLYICFIIVLTGVLYWPVRTFDFLNWDDPVYVTDNPVLRSPDLLKQLFWTCTSSVNGMWHPLTSLSFVLEYRLVGMQSGCYHLTNLYLHLINCIVLFSVLRRISLSQMMTCFVVCVFAVHPVNIESVAWISERKGFLGSFFWLTTMYSYLDYVRSNRRSVLLTTNILFVLGLLAKPFLVSLPLILLMLDIWPLRRVQVVELNSIAIFGRFQNVLIEKTFMFVASFFACCVSMFSQDAFGAIPSLPMDFRRGNAFESFWHYCWSTFVPLKLSPLYSRPEHWEPTHVLLCIVMLSGITYGCFLLSRRQPFILFGWCWFVVTLIPVCGIVPHGPHCFADRYLYIPAIGLSFCAVYTSTLFQLNRKWLRIVSVAVICTLIICAIKQLAFWSDPERLWQRVLAVETDNYIAHNNLGNVYCDRECIHAAKMEFLSALRLQPHYERARANLIAINYIENDIRSAKINIEAGVRFSPTNTTFLKLYYEYL